MTSAKELTSNRPEIQEGAKNECQKLKIDFLAWVKQLLADNVKQAHDQLRADVSINRALNGSIDPDTDTCTTYRIILSIPASLAGTATPHFPQGFRVKEIVLPQMTSIFSDAFPQYADQVATEYSYNAFDTRHFILIVKVQNEAFEKQTT